jgi:HD-like signal output (HDOD) protein
MDPIDRLVQQIDRFPTLPHVATASLAELEREECDFHEIARLISLDAVLAGRVLRLANSAYFGTGRPTESIKTAIIRLGVNEVRNCLLTVAVMNAIPVLPKPHDAKLFWTLSLASGLVAQRIAIEIDGSPQLGERAYAGGLVHLVGEAVLALQFTERYCKAIDVARGDAIPFDSALAEEFGCDYATVSARVLREWSFPEPLIRAVHRHFAPEHADDQAVLASLILAGDGLCRDLGLGLEDPGTTPRAWIPRLAVSFIGQVERKAQAPIAEYFDGLTDTVKECIDFAVTVF